MRPPSTIAASSPLSSRPRRMKSSQMLWPAANRATIGAGAGDDTAASSECLGMPDPWGGSRRNALLLHEHGQRLRAEREAGLDRALDADVRALPGHTALERHDRKRPRAVVELVDAAAE